MISINQHGANVKMVNGTTLRAQGNGNSRTSSLTLATSVQLNGHVVMCSETANAGGVIHDSTISVWSECICYLIIYSAIIRLCRYPSLWTGYVAIHFWEN